VALTGVGKWFAAGQGRVEALRGVSFSVQCGEFVAVVGPSGCGKSTLLRLIAGLLVPSEGEVLVDGAPPGVARAAKRIGYIPQESALLPWRTVLDNVALGLEVNARRSRREAREQAWVQLAVVGLAEFAGRYPYQLSGGMRQRVALARALVIAPRLLLLDEPFAALDELSREAMRYELLALWERVRASALLVTHSIAEAVALADRVLVLSPRPGRVVGEARPELPRPRAPEVERSAAFLAAQAAVRGLLGAR